MHRIGRIKEALFYAEIKMTLLLLRKVLLAQQGNFSLSIIHSSTLTYHRSRKMINADNESIKVLRSDKLSQ